MQTHPSHPMKKPNAFRSAIGRMTRFVTRGAGDWNIPDFAVQDGGFEIGRQGRRLAGIPDTTIAINSLISRYGRSVVARSRYLCANNPYASSAKEVFVSAFAGEGIKPSSLNETASDKKKVQELWKDWTEQADFDGLTDFYGLQGLIAAEVFEAGEVFVHIRPDSTPLDEQETPSLKLRVLPSEMLPFWHNSSWGQNHIEMGVEFDPDGKRVAYWFLRKNPGDLLFAFFGNLPAGQVRIPAEEVLHLFRPIRAGQIRGVPHTLASLVTLAMLDLYDDAELERKRTAALFAAFVTKDASLDDGDDPLGRPVAGNKLDIGAPLDSVAMEPGAVIDLRPGEQVTFASPADVGNSYEAFQYRNLLRAMAGMGVPYMAGTGDLRQANYGSIRAGLVEFRRRIGAMQKHIMIHQLCRPVWNMFLDRSALQGLLPWSADEYLKKRADHRRVKWLAPKWDWVDPLKDQQAEKLAVDNGFKSRDDTIEEEGYDAAEVDQRILDAQNREDSMGIRINRFDKGPAAAAEVAAEQAAGGDGVDPNNPPDPAPVPAAPAAPAKVAPAPAPKKA